MLKQNIKQICKDARALNNQVNQKFSQLKRELREYNKIVEEQAKLEKKMKREERKALKKAMTRPRGRPKLWAGRQKRKGNPVIAFRVEPELKKWLVEYTKEEAILWKGLTPSSIIRGIVWTKRENERDREWKRTSTWKSAFTDIMEGNY